MKIIFWLILVYVAFKLIRFLNRIGKAERQDAFRKFDQQQRSFNRRDEKDVIDVDYEELKPPKKDAPGK